ncbi:Uncharacterized protein FWK35_00022842 [Aphis craccivora]|uniref:Uncharacterized protein n=1 Tax=Aphis craccivora TaxID=307492 RepID=A0A6G0YA69_APHCR|nr:Uncharacterized protein FWK35_00022842 [Aphis craccivora]
MNCISINTQMLDTNTMRNNFLSHYSYNRRGECDVRVNIIYNRNENVESTVIQKIYFDTTITQGISVFIFKVTLITFTDVESEIFSAFY